MHEAGFAFEVIAASVVEIAPGYFTAGEITLFNARAKAQAVARLRPDAVVLGVDTLVAFEGEIFGKPSDLNAALAMLRRLNGRSHEVYSGVALRHAAASRENHFFEISRVMFRTLSEAQLRAYLERIGPLDKAGAYAAQDDSGELIARVEGSFTNVIGLPMEAVTRALAAFGISAAGAALAS